MEQTLENPKDITAAIENVSGMTSIKTSIGNVSLTSSQFTFLKLLRKGGSHKY